MLHAQNVTAPQVSVFLTGVHQLPPSSADVTESGSLNLPEPSGPHRPVMGLLYLYLYINYWSQAKDGRLCLAQPTAPRSAANFTGTIETLCRLGLILMYKELDYVW
jgi:hypothetical protein